MHGLFCGCRQCHEEAARYCSQQRETAAQLLNLHPSAEKTAPVQDGAAKGVLLSTGPPVVIRDAVGEKVANSSSAADRQHSSSVHGAPKQHRPQGFDSKQDAASSSRDSLLDVAAEDGGDDLEQTEAGFAAAPSMGKLICCLCESCPDKDALLP